MFIFYLSGIWYKHSPRPGHRRVRTDRGAVERVPGAQDPARGFMVSLVHNLAMFARACEGIGSLRFACGVSSTSLGLSDGSLVSPMEGREVTCDLCGGARMCASSTRGRHAMDREGAWAYGDGPSSHPRAPSAGAEASP